METGQSSSDISHLRPLGRDLAKPRATEWSFSGWRLLDFVPGMEDSRHLKEALELTLGTNPKLVPRPGSGPPKVGLADRMAALTRSARPWGERDALSVALLLSLFVAGRHVNGSFRRRRARWPRYRVPRRRRVMPGERGETRARRRRGCACLRGAAHSHRSFVASCGLFQLAGFPSEPGRHWASAGEPQ